MWKCEFSLSADCKPIVGTFEGFITSVNVILQFEPQRILYFTPKIEIKMPDGNSSMKDHLPGPSSPAQGFLHHCTSNCTNTPQGRAWRAHPEADLPVPLWGAVLELGRAAMPWCDWQEECRQREEIKFNHCFHHGLPNCSWANCVSILCLSSPLWPKAVLKALSKLKTTV